MPLSKLALMKSSIINNATHRWEGLYWRGVIERGTVLLRGREGHGFGRGTVLGVARYCGVALEGTR